ncbi:rhodanese-like domain-containing protein [Inhella sp.]|uniref:rhodanese-like domain-containing protein n=1 Tax=Inhella sp. TaxID=1921806 RepID=UPI0035B24A6E
MKLARRTLLLLCPALALQAQPAPSVPLEVAREALGQGKLRVIDIREPTEHAAGVAEGAQLLPMSQLPQRLAELPGKDEPLLLICRTQNRSKATAQKLREAGYTQVQYVEGGMSEWVKRGWPTVKP